MMRFFIYKEIDNWQGLWIACDKKREREIQNLISLISIKNI